MLTGIEYRTNYDQQYIRRIVEGLTSIIGDGKTIVITGVGFREGETVSLKPGQSLHLVDERLNSAFYEYTEE